MTDQRKITAETNRFRRLRLSLFNSVLNTDGLISKIKTVIRKRHDEFQMEGEK